MTYFFVCCIQNQYENNNQSKSVLLSMFFVKNQTFKQHYIKRLDHSRNLREINYFKNNLPNRFSTRAFLMCQKGGLAFLFDCAKYLTKTYTQGNTKWVQYGKIKWNKRKTRNDLFYNKFLLSYQFLFRKAKFYLVSVFTLVQFCF